jgi:hypothetical protein
VAASIDGCVSLLIIEMTPKYQEVWWLIRERPRRWLITGVAGWRT